MCLPGDQDRRTVRTAAVLKERGRDRFATERACWRAACAEQKSHAGCHLGQNWAAGF